MRENIRLILSLLWFPSVGFTFASGLVFILTLGDYAQFFGVSLAAAIVTTLGVLITALK